MSANATTHKTVRIALGAALMALAVALVLVLSHPPLSVAGTNGVPIGSTIGETNGSEENCQGGGNLPQGTTAARISLLASVGPRVSLVLKSGKRIITTGHRDSGWGVDASVTVPVKRVSRAVPNTTACIKLGRANEPILIHGDVVGSGSKAYGIWLRMEYLRPGHVSWLSRVGSIAERLDTGRSPSGSWAALIAVALMLGLLLVIARLILREAQ